MKQKTVTVISAPTAPEEIPSMEIPAVPTTVTDIIPFSTPDDTTKAPNHSSDIVSSAITTTTRKLVVPDAPRKFINRMHSTNIKSGNVVSGNSSPLSEEIEDSFQDDIHDLHSAAGSMVGKQHIGNAQKRSLVLKPSSNKVTPAQHVRILKYSSNIFYILIIITINNVISDIAMFTKQTNNSCTVPLFQFYC